MRKLLFNSRKRSEDPMESHHEAQLNSAIDQLYLEGATTIRWDQMYLWFDADRLGKTAYREIIKRWEQFCSKQGYSAPDLSVLHWPGKPTLTLIREPFEDEESTPLSEWTK